MRRRDEEETRFCQLLFVDLFCFAAFAFALEYTALYLFRSFIHAVAFWLGIDLLFGYEYSFVYTYIHIYCYHKLLDYIRFFVI